MIFSAANDVPSVAQKAERVEEDGKWKRSVGDGAKKLGSDDDGDDK